MNTLIRILFVITLAACGWIVIGKKQQVAPVETTPNTNSAQPRVVAVMPQVAVEWEKPADLDPAKEQRDAMLEGMGYETNAGYKVSIGFQDGKQQQSSNTVQQ